MTSKAFTTMAGMNRYRPVGTVTRAGKTYRVWEHDNPVDGVSRAVCTLGATRKTIYEMFRTLPGGGTALHPIWGEITPDDDA